MCLNRSIRDRTETRCADEQKGENWELMVEKGSGFSGWIPIKWNENVTEKFCFFSSPSPESSSFP